MSKSSPPTDNQKQPVSDHGSSDYASVSIYYMDYRNTGDDGPGREDMYSFTPTVVDLMSSYTFITDYEARSLSNVFRSWNNNTERQKNNPEAWRTMEVGDIIVFDDDPYIIRPAGYDKLDIAIPE